jgi:hypothetical protein
MTRWISADDNTAQALRGREIPSEVGSVDALDSALSAPSAVLVLPGGSSDVIVARLRHGAQPAAFEVHRWSDERAVGYTAGGMLGLLDEPVYEEEEQPKKKWWQRIVE